MKKSVSPMTVILILVLILIAGIFAYKVYFSPATSSNVPASETVENTKPPTFTWKYEKADTLNPDGQPNINVILEAEYKTGFVQDKLIDTSHGGCADLPDAETDSVPGSTVAQCYGAGLGFLYKVTKGENSYLVLRKMFEESLPDQEHVTYEYVKVAEFPFTAEN
jgi:hypothetical protein